eukprot:UN21775
MRYLNCNPKQSLLFFKFYLQTSLFKQHSSSSTLQTSLVKLHSSNSIFNFNLRTLLLPNCSNSSHYR